MRKVKISITNIRQFRFPSMDGNFHLAFTTEENSDKVEIEIQSKRGGFIYIDNKERAEELIDLLIKFTEGEIFL